MPTKSETINGIVLQYNSFEQDTADAIRAAILKSLQLIEDTWGLQPPKNCSIYVMTSPMEFVFQSAPWSWRIFLGVTLPFWLSRVQRTWPYSAAWTQNYGQKVAIGIKAIRLIEQTERRVGVRMFVQQDDPVARIQHVTCHELVHACSAHLKLPMWLNEGLATLTVERYFNQQIIRQDTLQVLKDFRPKAPPPTYRELSKMDLDAIAYHGIRAYWLVRTLEDILPGFLTHILATERDFSSIENTIANQMGITANNFWLQIDEVIARHFMTE